MRFVSLSLLTLLAAAPTFAAESAATAAAVVPEIVRLDWGSYSLYVENDKFFAGTDQRYTNGLKFTALTSNLRRFTGPEVPAPIRWISQHLSRVVARDEIPKLGLSFGQNIYTPTDTQNPNYQPDDRPYSAWLYAGVSFQNYRPPINAYGDARTPRLDILEFNLGMVGPWALGEEFQNNYHRLIDVRTAKGWRNQIKNEPGLNIIFERKWRHRSGDLLGTTWAADFIPHAGFSLGNVFTYANAGFEARVGYHLPGDFGTNLIRPTGDSNPLLRFPFNAFLFVGVDARAVARDITLDGNTFRDSPSIDREWGVADFASGLAFGTRRWQFTYTQAVRTREFKGQADNQEFGSVSITFFR
ncbi:lipid A deacylase LpxR family protein [Opitutaceae bacterium]